MVPNRAAAKTSAKRADREHLRRDPHRPEHEAREPFSERAPAGAPGELRRLPEPAEEEEGDDEDDGAAPVEEPRRDGEVADPPDPVREQARQRHCGQGLTVMSARSASGLWSSSSKRPGSFAVNWITVGLPIRGVFSMS